MAQRKSKKNKGFLKKGSNRGWRRAALGGAAMAMAMANTIYVPPAYAVCPGTISGSSTAACTMTGADSLIITSTGKLDLSGKSTTAVYIDSLGNGATINNSGLIDGGDYNAISVQAGALNTTITNNTGATIAALGTTAVSLGGDLDGSLTNSGTIASGSSSYSTYDVRAISVGGNLSGTLTNNSNGIISAIAQGPYASAYGLSMYDIETAGNLLNSGNINAVVNSTATDITDSAAYASTTASSAYGIDMGELYGTLDNSGTINASVEATANATGAATATAYAYGYNAYGLDMSGLYGTLDNSGNINAGLAASATADADDAYAYAYGYNATGLYMNNLEAGGMLLNSGTINAMVDMRAMANGATTATAYAYGYYAYGLDMDYLSGTLDNSGTISAGLTASATARADDAYASAYGSSATALSMNNIEAGGMLLNSGNINASVEVTAIATGANTADAYAYGYNAYGLDMDYLSGILDNSGTIGASLAASATADAADAYAYAYGYYATGLYMYDIEAGSQLLNSGTISALVDMTAIAYGVNTADAYAYGYYAYGLDMDYLYGTLNNSGTISADLVVSAKASGKDAYAYASGYTATALNMYDIEAGGKLLNSGTISASIDVTAVATGSTTAQAYVDYAEYAYAIDMGELYGTLDNSGNINANIDATAVANASAGAAYATVYSAYSAYGIYNMDDIVGGASLLNSGTISASINATATANGANWASATVTYAEYAYGIDMGYLYGTLDNSGTISASIDAQASANAPAGHAYASVEYASYAYGIDMSSIEAGGKLLNSGTISAAINAIATANGSTSAQAYIDYAENAYGIDMSYLYGTLDNSGTISASINATANATANAGAADATVYSAYYAYGIDMYDIEGGAALLNSGTISASLNAAATANGATSASANVTYADYAYGIDMSSLYGTLDNSGTIRADIDAQAHAIAPAGYAYARVGSAYSAYGIEMSSVEAGGKLLNSGTISASINAAATANGSTSAQAYIGYAEYAYGIDMSDLYGTLDNSGTISAGIDAVATATATTGAAYATVYSGYSAYGVSMNTVNAGASLLNSGTINASINAAATANGATLASANVTYADYAYGIDMGYLYGTLDNSGTISASIDAQAAANAPGGYAYASVEYAYYAYGIDIYSIEAGAKLLNSGTISAAINAAATANGSTSALAYVSSAYDAYGVSMSSLYGTLTNSGTISAGIDAAANAIATTGPAYATASVTNVYGINMSSIERGGELLNSGTISASLNSAASASGGTTALASASAYGYYAYGLNMSTLDGVFDNSGTISAEATVAATATGGHAKAYAYGSSVYGISMGAINYNNLGAGNLVNSGTISAVNNVAATAVGTTTATATASAEWVGGIWTDNVYDTLDNSGVISAVANVSASATADNAFAYANSNNVTPVIFVTAPYVTALHVGDIDSRASVSNSGTISASSTASAVAKATDIASATASASAIGMNAATVYGAITNSGTISATADALATAVGASPHANAYAIAKAVDIETIATDGTLSNSGTIGALANAVASETFLSEAYGVSVNTMNGKLSNSGTITGITSGGSPANGYSLHINTGTGTIMNEAPGLLYGNLYAGGTISVDNLGTIALPTGSSAYIGGDYNQGSTGNLGIGATSTTNYAQLNVSGTATMAPGSGLAVGVAKGNTLVTGDTLVDVITAGTLSADDTLVVTGNNALLDFTAVIDGNTIDLGVTRHSVTSLIEGAGNTGSTGAGALFDYLLAGNWQGGGMDDALSVIWNDLQTHQQVVDAIGSTLPILNGDMPRAIAGTKHGVNRIINKRQGGNQGMNSGDGFFTDHNVWLKPFASTATQDDNNGALGYDADSYGLMLGADGKIGSNFRLGFAFAYSTTDVDGNGGAAREAKVKSYQGNVYGTLDISKGTELNWQADYGNHSNEITRNMPLFGRIASADYDSWSAHAGVEVAKDLVIGTKTSLTPSVRLDYTMIEDDGYTETGAGSLNLTVDKNKTDELIFGIDGKLTHDMGIASLTANLGVGYDALADDDSITASFAGAPSAAFETVGVDPSPWLYGGGLGVSMGSKDIMEFTVRYDVEARQNFLDQSLSLKLQRTF